jgi:hypothetical protein
MEENEDKKYLEATYKLYEGIHRYRLLEEWVMATLPERVMPARPDYLK